jgi:hypothetical protein
LEEIVAQERQPVVAEGDFAVQDEARHAEDPEACRVRERCRERGCGLWLLERAVKRARGETGLGSQSGAGVVVEG